MFDNIPFGCYTDEELEAAIAAHSCISCLDDKVEKELEEMNAYGEFR